MHAENLIPFETTFSVSPKAQISVNIGELMRDDVVVVRDILKSVQRHMARIKRRKKLAVTLNLVTKRVPNPTSNDAEFTVESYSLRIETLRGY